MKKTSRKISTTPAPIPAASTPEANSSRFGPLGTLGTTGGSTTSSRTRSASVRAAAWGGFLYVSVFSVWLGFFAWYRGLQLGGMLRVSQIQLLQPFLSMLLALPLLGEPLQPLTVGFALAVMATVFLSRRMAVAPPPALKES